MKVLKNNYLPGSKIVFVSCIKCNHLFLLAFRWPAPIRNLCKLIIVLTD